MRLAVSMRVDRVEAYGEERDALDRAWYDVLCALLPGADIFPVPNRPALARQLLARVRPQALVLTGGNDIGGLPGARSVSIERDEVERALLEHAREKRLRSLAVCRGFQFMNLHLGGEVVPCHGHVAASHTVTTLAGSQPFTVNSYHGFGIPPGGLAAGLRPLLCDEHGAIEAAAHETLPWLAVMWHPERDGNQEPEQALRVKAMLDEAWA